MLKAHLIAPAVALLLGGAAVAQPMPLPPSVGDTSAAAAKPGIKKAPKKRAPAAAERGTRVQRPSQSTGTTLRPFDRRDIADPRSESRFQPQITPSGGLGMGGRF
jgi:hypothetical protein